MLAQHVVFFFWHSTAKSLMVMKNMERKMENMESKIENIESKIEILLERR